MTCLVEAVSGPEPTDAQRRGAYSRNACRCAKCKKAKADYIRARRARASALRRAQPGRRLLTVRKHGTGYAYYEGGCGCPKCIEWKRNRDRTEKRKSA